jgi:ABC-type lipoprotein release transport system permease subunit
MAGSTGSPKGTGGMVTNREGAFSVSIVGIEPEKEATVNLVAKNVSGGRFLTSTDQESMFIGKGLAAAMNVSVGDRVTLIGRTASKQMRKHTMTVVGIYDLQMAEIEKLNVYLPLADAQYLYDLDGRSSEVAITLKQIGEEGSVIRSLAGQLPGYEFSDWATNFPELTSALETKSFAMNLFGIIVMAVAGIGVLNMLLMAVYERTREIGILGALGMKPHQIRWLFLLEGAMIGLVGVLMGVALGLAVNGLLGKIGIDYSKYSGITSYTALITGRIYTTLGLENIIWRAPIILLISIIFAVYPAYRASQREPAEALHYV